jgi:hypothetical protein
MRGRVMALWFVAFQGSTPIGGPIVGLTMELGGARAGLGLGAVTCLVVAALGALALGGRLRRVRRTAGAAAGLAATDTPVRSLEATVPEAAAR